jgi:hypothetical protein
MVTWTGIRIVGLSDITLTDVRSVAELESYVSLAELEDALAGLRLSESYSNQHFSTRQLQPHEPEDPPVGNRLPVGDAQAVPAKHRCRSPSPVCVGDPACLGASLAELVGHPAYGLAQLRDDLERFVFLLGGSDGESLFGPAR